MTDEDVEKLPEITEDIKTEIENTNAEDDYSAQRGSFKFEQNTTGV